MSSTETLSGSILGKIEINSFNIIWNSLLAITYIYLSLLLVSLIEQLRQPYLMDFLYATYPVFLVSLFVFGITQLTEFLHIVSKDSVSRSDWALIDHPINWAISGVFIALPFVMYYGGSELMGTIHWPISLFGVFYLANLYSESFARKSLLE